MLAPILIVLVLILFNLPNSESSADMQERFWLKADREQWRKERKQRRERIRKMNFWRRWWYG